MDTIDNDDAPDDRVRDADTVSVAVSLIARLAEDPLVPSSYRVAARRHLKRFRNGAHFQCDHSLKLLYSQ